jgi:ribonuclease HI
MDPDFPWASLHWIAQITATPHITRDADSTLTPKSLRLLMQEPWKPLTPTPLTKIPQLRVLHPRWDQDIFTAFTDGSCAQAKTRNFCGAGIYLPTPGRRITLDPRGVGETNTINRAELAALQGATHPDVVPLTQDVHIFTDSKCSQLQINKYLLHPEAFRHHLHRDMIRCISEQIRDRALAGGHTHIHKVRGHAGIIGNEEADAVAGLARRLVTEGKDTDRHTGHIESEPRKQMYWLYHQGSSLPNLKKSPRDLARKSRQCLTLCRGIYQRLHVQGGQRWSEGAHKSLSNATLETKIMAARFNGGTVYTNKLEARHKGKKDWRLTPCSCCPGIDGGTHTFCGCQHKQMKACYINRHNKSVRILAKEIKKHSNHLFLNKATYIMDAGTPDDTEGFMGTRIPQWMLPNDNTRWTHRPDILLLLPEDEDPIPIDQASLTCYQQSGNWEYHFRRIRQDYRLLIIEVGYTSDHTLHIKDVEKQAQHVLLAAKLAEQGWKSPGPPTCLQTIDIVSIPLGVCGRFLQVTEEQLQQLLKFTPHTARTTLQKMGKVGVDALVGIYKCKRHLDREAKALRQAHT